MSIKCRKGNRTQGKQEKQIIEDKKDFLIENSATQRPLGIKL